ncbi:MAG TPA: DUF4157 domain-containing protein, partial [Thermoanaerobaculia bacterium]|nr:DUF4157 domain-containing protein [Thermoanaerobaculia bacterium]
MNSPSQSRVPSPARVIQGSFQEGRPRFLTPSPTTVAQTAMPRFPGGRPPLAPPPGSHFPTPAPTRSTAVQPAVLGTATRLPEHLANFPRGPAQPMPGEVQSRLEALFGADFSDVRVHVGPQANALGAFAFTRGADLFFAPGQYSPATPHGLRLLGHELTHVVQQRQGRVRNPFGSGIAVVQDPGLEAEAQRMGLRAVGSQAPQSQARPALGAVQPLARKAPPPALKPGMFAGSVQRWAVADEPAAELGRYAAATATAADLKQTLTREDVLFSKVTAAKKVALKAQIKAAVDAKTALDAKTGTIRAGLKKGTKRARAALLVSKGTATERAAHLKAEAAVTAEIALLPKIPMIKLPATITARGAQWIGNHKVPAAFSHKTKDFYTDDACIKHVKDELKANPTKNTVEAYFAEMVSASEQAYAEWKAKGKGDVKTQVQETVAYWNIILKPS